MCGIFQVMADSPYNGKGAKLFATLHTFWTLDKHEESLQPPDKAMYLKKIAVIDKVDPYVHINFNSSLGKDSSP
ncbi:hypothetical protein ILYODFUR_005646 [Ilyodon furcidens]|uniref:Uncharacterized protein n=1 Tax=Ilyodon furcidens TaxID=33524 RepID=A0ABV0TSJ3_9TELE